jgi:pimeloyl-ACP methyl ester carboxylesterase
MTQSVIQGDVGDVHNDLVTHRRIQANRIDMHIAEAGSGPAVVFVHGFPELWYSWRHQLPVVAEARLHAVAPDLRGYGETDVAVADESYAVSNACAESARTLPADAARGFDSNGRVSRAGVTLTNA